MKRDKLWQKDVKRWRNEEKTLEIAFGKFRVTFGPSDTPSHRDAKTHLKSEPPVGLVRLKFKLDYLFLPLGYRSQNFMIPGQLVVCFFMVSLKKFAVAMIFAQVLLFQLRLWECTVQMWIFNFTKKQGQEMSNRCVLFRCKISRYTSLRY